MDVTELKELVKTLSTRSDIPDSVLDVYIDMVESDINQEMESSLMIEDFLYPDPWDEELGVLQLPSNFSAGRFLVYHGTRDIVLANSSMAKVLEDRGRGNKIPTRYAIANDYLFINALYDFGDPLENTVFRFHYYTRIPSLRVAFSNQVLDSYPNVYVYGLLHHIFNYAMDEDRATYWYNKYSSAMNGMVVRERVKLYAGSAPTPTDVIEEQ